jgi:hypothetical protein
MKNELFLYFMLHNLYIQLRISNKVGDFSDIFVVTSLLVPFSQRFEKVLQLSITYVSIRTSVRSKYFENYVADFHNTISEGKYLIKYSCFKVWLKCEKNNAIFCDDYIHFC